MSKLDIFKYRFSTGQKGIQNLFKIMRGGGGKVKIGVIGTKASAPKKSRIKSKSGKAPKTLAEIAAIHEFGLGGMHKRSFIRAWVDQNQSMIRSDIRKAIEKVAIGRLTIDQALKVLGVKWVGDVQEFITNPGNFKALEPETIKRKGSSNPLIDTGQLRSSISYEIVK